MNVILYCSKSSYLLSILITFLLIKCVITDDEVEICNNVECKSILMKGKIFFIKTDENDKTINYYDFGNNRVNSFSIYYTDNIKYHKNILKLNETYFIIVGFNRQNTNLPYTFNYEIYSINNAGNDISLVKSNNNNINLDKEVSINTLSKVDFKSISRTSRHLIISGRVNSNFMIFSYNILDDTCIKYQIPSNEQVDSNLLDEDSSKEDIRCNSIDGDNFFCVFYYRIDGDKYPMYYVNGKFGSTADDINKNIKNICSNSQCVNGNVEAINDNGYLMCYQEKTSGYFYTRCKYYTYISEYLEEKGEINQYDSISFRSFIYAPLIIYHYNYSIFIGFNYKTSENEILYVIISSLDLNIKLEIKLFLITNLNEGQYLSTFNLFNDDNYNYHVYKQFSGTNSYKMKVIRREIVKCKPAENKILSVQNESLQFNFVEKRENFDIKFSTNQNLRFSFSKNTYNHLYDLNTNFIFTKTDSVGVFSNYYLYTNGSETSSYFSLICPLIITTCYDLCNSCTPYKVGTSTDQHCKTCKGGYHHKDEDSNKEDFNCYQDEELIMNYYYDTTDKTFKRCNETCKYCDNPNSCKACADGYYFKFEERLKNDNICFTGPQKEYYLSTHEGIKNSYMNFNEIIDTVYRKCYETCETCLGNGSLINNNCDQCKNNLIKYNFENRQCLINYTQECYDRGKYWEIKNNNITCLIGDCDDYVILYGINKGQCVKDCNNFVDPNDLNSAYYTLLGCGDRKYCIPLEVCLNGKFDNINYVEKSCRRKSEFECNINVFEGIDKDPFIHDYDTEKIIETTILTSTYVEIPFTNETKQADIDGRFKVVKEYIRNGSYYGFNKCDVNLINDYYKILKNELNEDSGIAKKKGIYLILLLQYDNFNITIYPIDIENYVYENIIIPHKIGFINFQNYLTDYYQYEIDTRDILLVILLESLSLNSSVNELNYYFYSMNEKNYDKRDCLNNSNLNLGNNNDSRLEIKYPLKSYINENSTLKESYTKYLLENINSFHSKYPDIELYNIDDPFFNDICYNFTSENGADMTLNDRRQEYYINKSLCEDNCYLEQLLINENSIKSVCSCEFKKEFSLNKNAGQADEIPSISKMNAKAILCIEKTFKAENVAKNPVFWVFVILIIFLIVMLLAYIFYGNGVLKRILRLGTSENNLENSQEESDNNEEKENNNVYSHESDKRMKINSNEDDISDIKELKKKNSLESSKSNEINKLIINNNKNNKMNNINNNLKNMSPKNSSIYDYNINNNNNKKDSFDKNKSIPIDSASSNNNKLNPPKKNLNKEESITTKAGGEEKDLLSNDPSLIKKYQSSEISYESINGEKPILIDNLLENGVEMENNYINYPKEYEKRLVFNLIRGAIYPTEENEDDNLEEKHKYNSDIFEHNYNPELIDNYKKKIKEKSKLVTKLLEGEDLFNEKDHDKGYNSDNVEENKYDKYKKGSKKDELDENEYFPNISENIITNYKNSLKTKKPKNKRDSKKEEDKSNDTNNLINDDTSKNNTKKDHILTISETIKVDKKEERYIKHRKPLRRSDIMNNDENNDEDNEEGYGKKGPENKGKIKTDVNNDEDNNIKIKETLKEIAKDGIESKDESNSSSIKKDRSFISNDSGKGMIKNDPKNKLKSGNKMNINKFNFQEEEEKNGDTAYPENNKNNKKLNNLKKNLKKKSIKNKKVEKDDDAIKISLDNEKDKKEEIVEKKSDFEIFNEKVLGSSVSSFFETTADKKEKKDLNFAKFYWKYFKNRELILVSFIDTKDTIPYFIRWSCFVFCLFFLFMLNCLFLLESTVHDKYENIKNGGDDIKYYFKHQLVFSIYVSLIYIVFKMVIIKLVLNRALKVKKDAKRMMEHSYEKELTQIDLANLKEKRVDYLVNYHTRIIIYFVALFILSLFVAYICVCYSEVFKNSVTSILLGFVFSIIFSFIFCALICLIIITFYKVGKKLRNKCLLSTYVVFSTMY